MCSLLDRHRHGVAPTAYGRALLNSGVAVFDELRQAVKNIEHIADPASGDLRIGSSPALAASFVSAVVGRLSRRYPRIVFHVLATQWEGLYRALNERNIDFVIAPRFGPFADDELGFETVYENSYVVIAGARNPWVGRRRIELAELMNETLGASTAGDCARVDRTGGAVDAGSTTPARPCSPPQARCE